jgi:hypothetical protein
VRKLALQCGDLVAFRAQFIDEFDPGCLDRPGALLRDLQVFAQTLVDILQRGGAPFAQVEIATQLLMGGADVRLYRVRLFP